MQCSIELQAKADRPYLIKRDDFMSAVDRIDLACRDSDVIKDAYLCKWFFWRNGRPSFRLPSFQLNSGRTIFINGRHRTVMLFRHMNSIPMAITGVIGEKSSEVLDAIVDRPLSEDSTITLPDLPFYIWIGKNPGWHVIQE